MVAGNMLFSYVRANTLQKSNAAYHFRFNYGINSVILVELFEHFQKFVLSNNFDSQFVGFFKFAWSHVYAGNN